MGGVLHSRAAPPSPERTRGCASVSYHCIKHGATAIEGYPIDTRARGGELPPGFSTGPLSMFENEGFAAVASLPSARTLVHRHLGA